MATSPTTLEDPHYNCLPVKQQPHQLFAKRSGHHPFVLNDNDDPSLGLIFGRTSVFRLSFSPPSKFETGYSTLSKWEILGSYTTRKSFLEQTSRSYNSFTVITIYQPNAERKRDFSPWKPPTDVFARPLNTVVFDDAFVTSIMERVQLFIDTKTRCLERGLPANLGVLFLDPPGTVKTSLIKAIAHQFDFPIYIFNLGDTGLTDSHLMAMCDDMAPDAIALFEDIDRAKIGQQGITEAGLINVFDGVGTRGDGRLIFVTCNNEEVLPAALLRKGRIDAKYSFSLASWTQLKNLFLRTNLWTEEETKGLDLNKKAEDFANALSGLKLSPAGITAYLKEARDPNEAVNNFEMLVKESLWQEEMI
ncbi:putative mitochondrial chaperone bcs1 [Lachnellula arida]|uniref:Putative mitochondrial chaperone bcs1 n=1 Tax=Lachnellula arida TaxID=1316785 RepID=A0A8T9BHI0_9HELO|nr:putative mitochondrial chaperone bcs1 [Lachnellula arida]